MPPFAKVQGRSSFLLSTRATDRCVAWWVANKHDLCKSNRGLTSQTNMAAGHFSQAGVFSQVMEQAERYAFLMWALSACPDGQSGSASEALVFDLITVFIGMGIILGVSGKPGPLAMSCTPGHRPCQPHLSCDCLPHPVLRAAISMTAAA